MMRFLLGNLLGGVKGIGGQLKIVKLLFVQKNGNIPIFPPRENKMTTRHINADILIAIAEGKEVEYKKESTWETPNWINRFNPLTHQGLEWRIKPEVKPDHIMYIGIDIGNNYVSTLVRNSCSRILRGYPVILKLTYNEDSDIAKHVEIVK
jgi:hypothetical protein